MHILVSIFLLLVACIAIFATVAGLLVNDDEHD